VPSNSEELSTGYAEESGSCRRWLRIEDLWLDVGFPWKIGEVSPIKAGTVLNLFEPKDIIPPPNLKLLHSEEEGGSYM
jgi:hypothetical protein